MRSELGVAFAQAFRPVAGSAVSKAGRVKAITPAERLGDPARNGC